MTSITLTENFLQLIDTHKGIIYKVASLYCNDNEARKDLVQEIIVQLWRSFANYNNQYKHSTWIYKIALNVAISFYRKESSRKSHSTGLSESLFNIEEAPPDNDMEQNISILYQLIAQLKELDKALMILYLEQKTYKEIAQIVGLTETNVATKIGRIKAQFKQYFFSIKSS